MMHLVDKLVELTEKLVIGDPTDRKVNIGPVINKNAYRDYQNFVEELGKAGKILTGGKVLAEGELAKGYFCAPTLAETAAGSSVSGSKKCSCPSPPWRR